MTLLSIVQDAGLRVGVEVSGQVIGSSNPHAKQFLALLIQECRDLGRRHNWQFMTREHTWTANAASLQTNGLPTDFDRLIQNTFWNRTNNRVVYGPATAVEWQDWLSNDATTVTDVFRIRGGGLYLLPVPAGTETFAYEYVTNAICYDAAGSTLQTQWLTDSDLPLHDEEILILGLVWRFKRAKGVDYGEDFSSYETLVKTVAGRDGGTRLLSMNGRRTEGRVTHGTWPEWNWDI